MRACATVGKGGMMNGISNGAVIAVSRGQVHEFTKPVHDRISLLAGLGVDGDAHLGRTVQHRSRVAKDPTQPNLRQVHLLHEELLDELNAAGFQLTPGALGENITTRGVDLLGLPRGSQLHIGKNAIVSITGLRDPCKQLNDYRPGLMSAVLARDDEGSLIRKAGIMGVVLASGEVRPGDAIRVEFPLEPHHRLERI
jgi:MOSC domain-containing protein YiiM